MSLEDLRNPAGGGKVSAVERMEADISVASLPKAIGWELQQVLGLVVGLLRLWAFQMGWVSVWALWPLEERGTRSPTFAALAQPSFIRR